MEFLIDNFLHGQYIGSLVASSRFLTQKIIHLADVPAHTSLVEIGPGTGVFTEKILDALLPHQRFFVIEKDERLYDELRVRFPELSLFYGCASDIHIYMQQTDVAYVDCVISSLPRSLFDEALQDKILTAIFDAMEPGGTFLTFAYLQGLLLHNGASFKKKLSTYFSQVEESSTVRLNIPPAFVYVCKK